MWDDVVRANEVAIHTNEDERQSASVAAAMCTHPGLWLHYAYLQQGRFADARRMQSIHMPFRTAQELGLPNESELPNGRRAMMPFVMASGTWSAHVMIVHEQPEGDAKP